ncbi:MAG: hypothetical protein QOG55_511 [Acidobacteriaceae bacterium]|jgi:hypothetical protein|nr:hypothetical protein [Acidobacteriaceae bacterium]
MIVDLVFADTPPSMNHIALEKSQCELLFAAGLVVAADGVAL